MVGMGIVHGWGYGLREGKLDEGAKKETRRKLSASGRCLGTKDW
jgi:hypothetical protein